MKRIFSTLGRRASSTSPSASSYPDDSPEAIVLREVAAFCEAGSNPDNSQGSEYVHLPAIVESAESSPHAAKEAAYRIRKSLSSPATTPGYIQYNAVMLIRILIDNPGHTFTRNLDSKFAATMKDLLRQGRDMGVQQFVRETLEFMETQRSWDEDLAPLMQMWKKEKIRYQKASSAMNSRYSRSPPPPQQGQSYFNNPSRATDSTTLPPPDELSARIAESKNSANLLLQLVQSTPPAEVLDNELINEFGNRCRSASRVIQNYIHSSNPAPDEDTLVTLIETNDELSVVLSKYQRAILNARKTLGSTSDQSPASSGEVAASGSATRPVPAPPVPQRNEFSHPESSPEVVSTPPLASTGGVQGDTNFGPGRSEYRSEDFQVHNPFADDNTYSTTTGHTGNQQTEINPGTNGGWSNHQPTERTS